MDKKAVYITYGVVIGFTIVYQLFIFFIRRPKINEEYENLKNDVLNNESAYLDINKTASDSRVNLFK